MEIEMSSMLRTAGIGLARRFFGAGLGLRPSRMSMTSRRSSSSAVSSDIFACRDMAAASAGRSVCKE